MPSTGRHDLQQNPFPIKCFVSKARMPGRPASSRAMLIMLLQWFHKMPYTGATRPPRNRALVSKKQPVGVSAARRSMFAAEPPSQTSEPTKSAASSTSGDCSRNWPTTDMTTSDRKACLSRMLHLP